MKIRIVRPEASTGALPVVLYIHGGGWVLGNAGTHDRLVRELSVGIGAAVVFVEYTPSPDAHYPGAIEQTYPAASKVGHRQRRLRGARRRPHGCHRRFRGRRHDGDVGAAGVDGETTARLLSALGKDGPPDLTAHRRLLGERRALIVLDDVADEEQVRPLLGPGGRGVTMPTSRRRLTGLDGLSRVQLGSFSPGEATELLRAILADPYAPAIDLDEEAAAEIARLCGYLPLAMRVAGNRLRSRPAWMARTWPTGSPTRNAVSTAWSRATSRLALVPGPDAGTAVAVAAANLPAVKVAEALDELVELGLLESGRDDRHHFHDLVRLFPRERLADEEPEVEALRLMLWLLDTATTAGQWFEGDGTPDELFSDAEQAGAWLRAEADNWLTALRAGRGRRVVDAAEAMHWFSDFWANWHGWEEVFTLGRDASPWKPPTPTT